MAYSARDFHYGKRLKQCIDNSDYTAVDVAKKMGYSYTTALYDLFQKEWIKRDVLQKALQIIKVDESDFFGENETTELVKDQFQAYPIKKKFLEERVDDLEKQISALQNEIDKLSKSLKVTS